ncbi:uncharacterized protein TNCV_4775711 [Trichonephila clavipes]|nr:uncharacterized protein TNCV_4775711 [Trichonephila clavipes]
MPLVESCLPEEVLVAWERSRNHQTESEGSRSLEQLMNFLRQEVKGEEMVLLARTSVTLHQNPRKKDYHATQVNKVETTTTAALLNMDNPGRDGKIRTVRLKTLYGKILRPIQRIHSLEIRSNENLQRGLEESIPTVSETLSPDETSSLILTKVTQHLIDAPAIEFLEHDATAQVLDCSNSICHEGFKQVRLLLDPR